jgi:hypothetical protein
MHERKMGKDPERDGLRLEDSNGVNITIILELVMII